MGQCSCPPPILIRDNFRLWNVGCGHDVVNGKAGCLLAGSVMGSTCAVGSDEVADHRLETALGCYPCDPARHWYDDLDFDAEEVADLMPEFPNYCSDGPRLWDL